MGSKGSLEGAGNDARRRTRSTAAMPCTETMPAIRHPGGFSRAIVRVAGTNLERKFVDCHFRLHFFHLYFCQFFSNFDFTPLSFRRLLFANFATTRGTTNGR